MPRAEAETSAPPSPHAPRRRWLVLAVLLLAVAAVICLANNAAGELAEAPAARPEAKASSPSVEVGEGLVATTHQRIEQPLPPLPPAEIEQLRTAVQGALDWLRQHQDEDGHWDTANFMKHDTVGEPCAGAGNPVHDVGVTGLALLAFLGDGNTLRIGPYREVVRKGIKYLQLEQRESDGLLGRPSSMEYMYSHAIATLALCEAYGLSENYHPLQAPAQRALDYIAAARNPNGVWRYQPRGGDNDTALTGWMVQALRSGQEFGLQVDEAALPAALAWFDSVTDPTTGRAGYTQRGEGSSRSTSRTQSHPSALTEALTAEVLFCRIILGQHQQDVPVMGLAIQLIGQRPPVWGSKGEIDMYYWYFATTALLNVGGEAARQWAAQLVPMATATQCRVGNQAGSWDPVDAWGHDGGRVYATAMMTWCLNAAFRTARVNPR